MGHITLIAAIGKNNELGKDNHLIWRIPEDLKFFRENTMGKSIVMGMNTLNSLPKKLPNRNYIVLTRKEIDLGIGTLVFHNLEDLLEYIQIIDEEVMVIGGAQVYKLMIDYADKMLLTEINATANANVYFPSFSKSSWDKEIIGSFIYDEIDYSHVVYTRKRVKV